jgi:hypothetical protein
VPSAFASAGCARAKRAADQGAQAMRSGRRATSNDSQHGPQQGRHAVPMSGAEDRTASQPITLPLADGASAAYARLCRQTGTFSLVIR